MRAANRKPRTELDSPAIDSTERSISPAMITRAIGSDMIATSITADWRFAMFRFVRKTGDSRTPTVTRAISTTARSVSQRRSHPKREPPASGATIAGSATRAPTDVPLEAALEDRIHPDRDEDHGAIDRLEPELREVEQDQRIRDEREEQGAQPRPDRRTRAAEDRDAADDAGGDHLEHDTGRRRGVDRPELHAPEHAGQAGEHPARGEHREHDEARPDAEDRGGLGVASDRVHLPAE